MIHINDLTLSSFAEGMAAQGYKPNPEMMLARMGGIKVYSANGNLKPQCTRDYTAELNRAWTQALQLLSERGIRTDLPICASPFQATLDIPNRIGVWFDKDALHISAWVGNEFDWLTNTDDEANLIPSTLPEGAICPFSTQSGFMRSADLEMINDKVARVKVASANVYSDIYGTQSGTKLPQGTIVKGVADSTSATYKNVKFITTDNVNYIYPLAEPLTIPFDAPLNANISDVAPDDIIALTDTEGNDMFTIQSILRDTEQWNTLLAQSEDLRTNAEAHPELNHLVLAHPSQEWQTQHSQYAVSNILHNLLGFGFRIDGTLIIDMYKDLQQLKNKLNL